MEAAPGAARHLGKYRLDRLLGKGGMGEVYAAYDTTLDRVVALKTIRSEADDAQHAERFRREGRAAARLRHPLIVTVYELGEAEGKLFLAMEYLEGESLAAALRAGRLTLERKVEVLGHVLEGLEHAHRHGVVHRDVKPSNVQILPDGAVKILDFGIARLAVAESLSQTGMVLGTVPYMSPEQLRGERVDARTDVYAAGVVAYEMLTGRRPFDGGTLTEIVLKVINDPLPPMQGEFLGTWPGLQGLVARALDKCAGNRWPSAAAMATALQEAVAAPVAAPGPVSTTYRIPLAPAAPLPPVPSPAPALVTPAPSPRRVAARRVATALLALGVAGTAGLMAVQGGRRSAGGPTAGPAAPTAGEGGSSGPRSPAATAIPPWPAPPRATPRAAAEAQGPAMAGDAALARAVVRELRARGERWATGDGIRAHLVVALRKAPFASASALTADFSAQATVVRAGRAPLRCEVTGHALEFGEPAVRAAAVERAAEQLAACLVSR